MVLEMSGKPGHRLKGNEMTVILRVGRQVPTNLVDTLKGSDGIVIEFTDTHMRLIDEALQKFINPYGMYPNGERCYMELFQFSDTILDEMTEAEAMALIVNHLRKTLQTVVGFTDDHVLVATHNACGGSKFVSSQQFWYIFILLEQGIIEDGLFATRYTDGRVETMTKAEMFADVDR